MGDIIRTGSGKILSNAVEHNGLVYLQGVIAKDFTVEAGDQTTDILNQIDDLLARHGSNKSRILQAQIWIKDNVYREAMNARWEAWLPPACAPARACVVAEMNNPRCFVEIMAVAAK